MNQIYSNLSALLDMCKALNLKQDSTGFDIKLPPNITLSELSECTKDLNNVFTQCPLLHSDSEQIKLCGVDVGSMWLTFTIIGTGVTATCYIIKNIAAIVDKIVTIREHIAVCKQQEELARQAQLKNEVLQSIIESNKTLIKALTSKAAEDLAKANDITVPEDVERIQGSLKILKSWIDQGLEVYAAVDAPKEVKAVFPPLEVQALPNLNTKALETSNDSTEE